MSDATTRALERAYHADPTDENLDLLDHAHRRHAGRAYPLANQRRREILGFLRVHAQQASVYASLRAPCCGRLAVRTPAHTTADFGLRRGYRCPQRTSPTTPSCGLALVRLDMDPGITRGERTLAAYHRAGALLQLTLDTHHATSRAYTTTPCPACEGYGRTVGEDHVYRTCSPCGGVGLQRRGPDDPPRRPAILTVQERDLMTFSANPQTRYLYANVVSKAAVRNLAVRLPDLGAAEEADLVQMLTAVLDYPPASVLNPPQDRP